jgi:very-short-patch-repair endonuclease
MRGPDHKAVGMARRLRRQITDAEAKLWYFLRDRRFVSFKFVRQAPIGPYVADFLCRQAKLVIELDGGQHAESARDGVRDAYIMAQGYRVLRFWNSDVFTNREGVLTVILQELHRESSGGE